MSTEPLPDVAYAAALSALPDMTPAQLSRLLGTGPAKDAHERVAAGDALVLDLLLGMGRSRSAPPESPDRGGGVANHRGPAGRPEALTLLGSASDLERRRQGLLARLAAWSHELALRPVEEIWADLVARHITVVRRGEGDYPRRLLRADFPPEVLYVMGSLTHAAGPTVAIVGTRRATHYGMEIAGEIGQALAERGISVVSGLARGIDAAAHAGVLSTTRRTPGPVAVAGGGVDVVYPPENRRLWAAVIEEGALLSEAPPGAAPAGWRFPLRNRIIAALSQVVVIVESSRQGGAMHTVQAADSFGIPVLAVPGSVRSPQSEGTNAIIGEGGAALATDVYDVLTALSLASDLEGAALSFSPGGPKGATRPRGASGRRQWSRGVQTLPRPSSPVPEPASPADSDLAKRRLLASCSDNDRSVYQALEHTPTTVDVVCARTHHDLGKVALALDRLEELGLARSVGPSWLRV